MILRNTLATCLVFLGSCAADVVQEVELKTETASSEVGRKFFGSIWAAADEPNQLLQEYFDQVTPENSGKWGAVERSRDRMNWTGLDAMFQYARRHRLRKKTHTFVWGLQEPSWIRDLPPSEQRAEVEEWMRTFCMRYRDVQMIDVVNEPLHQPPSYKAALGGDSDWSWVVWSFEKARQHCPSADLLLNDFGILNNSGATTNYIRIIEHLKQRELIDGIGLQGHFLESASANTVRSNLNRLAALGLPIYITELDIDRSRDQDQLLAYQRLFPILWDNDAVHGVTFWGFLEGHMWSQSRNAYLLRRDGSERPALSWLLQYAGRTHPARDEQRDHHRVVIRAWGTPVGGIYPTMQLRHGPTVLGTWTVTSHARNYTVRTNRRLNLNLRVAFTNHARSSSEDRNLYIDTVTLNGTRHPSRGPSVLTRGCRQGYLRTNVLTCNGFFEYPTREGSAEE